MNEEVASSEAREEYARQARARIDAMTPEQRQELEWSRAMLQREIQRERDVQEYVNSFYDWNRPW